MNKLSSSIYFSTLLGKPIKKYFTGGNNYVEQ